MKFHRIIAALLFCLGMSGAWAQAQKPSGAALSQPAPPEIAERLSKRVQEWINDDRFKVEGIRTTPIAGLYEVQIRTDLFFVDEAGRYIIIENEMVDLTTNQNLTRLRMEEVMAVDFSELPLDKAIKNVNGDGKRVVALFEDPNCAYCRRLRADLNKVDNLTIYTFAYPILAADSDVKSRKALCAEDPSTAWNDLMMTGAVPDNDGTCSTALDEFKALGQRWGISATPTMFFPTGFRLRGYAPPSRFVSILEKNQ